MKNLKNSKKIIEKNSYSEVVNVILDWLSLELILGIIGTATGIIGLIIHFIRLRREKPIIKPEVIKCGHYLTRNKKHQPIFHLELELRIKNRGHHGTTLNKIEATFYDNEKRYLMESIYFQPCEGVRALMPTLPVENLWIGPHKTTNTRCRFQLEGEVIKQRILECSFILYHTHGKKTLRVTSPFSLSN